MAKLFACASPGFVRASIDPRLPQLSIRLARACRMSNALTKRYSSKPAEVVQRRHKRITSTHISKSRKLSIADTPLAQGIARRLRKEGITPAVAADVIGVSRSSIYQVLKSGKLSSRQSTQRRYQYFIDGHTMSADFQQNQSVAKVIHRAAIRLQTVFRDLQLDLERLRP